MNQQIQHYWNKLAYEVDAWDLNAALEAGESVIVIDTRGTAAYEDEHIPGAMNIPHRTVTAESTAQLDRGALVVTYCDGIGCNASTKGALRLAELGFEVRELIGGLDWWKRDGHPTDVGADVAPQLACGCG